METEIKSYLADIRQAAQRIIEVTLNKPFEEIRRRLGGPSRSRTSIPDHRRGNQRHRRKDEAIAALLGNYPQIIGLRNILAHRYRDILDRTVWGIIENNLPDLLRQVDTLLEDDWNPTSASNA